ncbi:MAG TPA: hypothetical protein VK599_19825, partial [Streptosporangiaceae bacterium]|nr:hypothetical protein [Streptosporangiaceae bacterium]
MTTPGSQAGPTAGDSDSAAGSPDWTVAPGLARPYANPAREYVTVPEPPPGRPAGAGVSSEADPDVELPPGWPGADRPSYQQTGYGEAGYDRAGYDPAGFDRAGQDRAGYDRAGSGWSDVGPGDRLGSETGELPLPSDTWPGPGLEDPAGG